MRNVALIFIVCSLAFAATSDAFLLPRLTYQWPSLTTRRFGSSIFDDMFDSLVAPHFGMPTMMSDDNFDSWDSAMTDMFDRWQVIRKCRNEEKQSLVNAASVTVENKEGAYEVVATLPGVQSQDVEVHLNGEENSITIKAKKERQIDCRCGSGEQRQKAEDKPVGEQSSEPKTDKEATITQECLETRRETFARTFSLPSNADLSKIHAQFAEKDSALRVTIPKSVPSKAKLPITVNKVESLPDSTTTEQRNDA